MSQNWKLTLSFLSSRFATWPKSRDKHLNILRTKRAFEVKWKTFLILFNSLSWQKSNQTWESAFKRLFFETVNLNKNSEPDKDSYWGYGICWWSCKNTKYKNVFVKFYFPNLSEIVFKLKNLRILCRRHMLLVVLMVKKSLEGFAKNICKWQIKKKLR